MPTARDHAGAIVHLNNAAASLPDPRVDQEMRGYMDFEASAGITETKLAFAKCFERLYNNLSAVANVPSDRIAVMGSAADVWQRSFLSLNLKPGDRILVGEAEWGGNLSAVWHRCARTGARMEVVASDEASMIHVDALSETLDDTVAIVGVTWAAAVNGGINPVHEIASRLARHPAWLFVDAAQSFGQVSTDLSNPRFDVVSVSARKYLRSPRGVAFGVFSERFLEHAPPLSLDQVSGPWNEDGPSEVSGAKKYEPAEMSYAARMGLAKAESRIRELARALRSGLASIPDVVVHDRALDLSGIVTFSNSGVSAADYRGFLACRGINIAAPGFAYGPLWHRNGRPLITRLSPHAFNTMSDVELALQAVEDCSCAARTITGARR